MNIPSYKANVGQYNVPSMNASGEFNNANLIYEGVAKVCDTITDAGIKYYKMEKAREAEEAGAEYMQKSIEEKGVDNVSLADMPKANTSGQAAFNQAAIDYYANSFNLETTQSLNRLAVANKNNAAGFLSASDSYLKGVSENIPAHLKGKILYPIQVKAQSAYNTILKQQMVDQETYMSEQFMFDTEIRVRNTANLNFATTDEDERASNDIAMAELEMSLRSQVGKPGGITAEYAMKKMGEARKSAAFSYVYNTVKGSDMDSEQSEKFFDSVVNGKTGNIYLDTLSPSERVEALTYSIGQYSKVEEEENRRTELLVDKADKNIDGAKMQFLDALGENPDMTSEELIGHKQNAMRFALTAEQRDAVNKFFSEDKIATSPLVKSEFDMKLSEGTLTMQDLKVARLNSILSFGDFTTYAVALKQPLSQNKKSDAWKLIEADIKARYGEKDSIFSVSDAPKNARKAYIERGMNEYMAQSLRTADELNAYYDRLTQEAKGIEGKELIIPEPIKKTIKAKIPSDDINEMALMYVSKKDVVENGRTKKKSVCDSDKVFLDVASMNPELSDDELKTNVSSLCTILVNAYDNMGL